ncbi:MAG: cbb3-type cytochrome c oxidase N-terminal domain-containing protein [Opitutaceae bacterium]
MTPPDTAHKSTLPGEDPLRPHSFDGIQEYDKRLPNWWLLTFYATIVFWIGYWLYMQQSGLSVGDGKKIDEHMARVEAVKLAANAALDDPSLWKMSRNPVFTSAGKATFETICASCHNVALTGGIGPNLVDATWIHGSKPTDLLKVVNEGVLVKGMPAWGPVLGTKKVSEAIAYVLSHHTPPAELSISDK